MHVRSVLAAEHRQRRVAIAGGHVAQDLIIGAVFTDDQEHMLNQRRIADLRWDCDRLDMRVAAGGRVDILNQVPVIVLEDLARHRLQGPAVRHGNDAYGAIILVGIVVGDAVVGLERITRADALVVGNDKHVSGLVQHDRARRIGYRDHADDRIRRALAEVDHRDRVGIVKRDVGNVSVDGDRVRRGAIGWLALAGHSDRQPKVDRPRHLVLGRIDNRESVAIGIGDQQVFSVERHPGRVQTGRDVSGDLHRGQINHRNGTGDCGAHYRVGNDFGAGGINLEVRLCSGPATLVADVGGRAVAVDHDAVRRVANADLPTLRRRLRGQVDFGERIVLVQQGVGAPAIL